MTEKTVLSLYREAERRRVPVYPLEGSRIVAVSVKTGRKRCIGLNYAMLPTRADEKVALAHELGHCATSSFYEPDAPLSERRRQEARAVRWSVRRLVPYPSLMRLLRAGVTERWQLADAFGVTEDFVSLAVDYYRSRGLLQTGDDRK